MNAADADADFSYGAERARQALRIWLADKPHVVLVTGGASYERCGASDFLSPLLGAGVLHLRVRSANPKVGDVQELLDGVAGRPVSAFVAAGGGSVIDTVKLLNLAYVLGTDVRSILRLSVGPPALLPVFALPTTDGTGAEATRFAVCYDGETKHSVDFAALRPGDVALVPEFALTLPPEQRASANFDAYAQAVESLWARGATDESRTYARRALALAEEGDWCRASYWSGRAIDISRTTAAHALSYYLTSHYGISHGAAVYMVFPYVCANNGHPERIRRFPALKTLREFAAEKGLAWKGLVEELFAHVNLRRLDNNPVALRKDAFASEPDGESVRRRESQGRFSDTGETK